MFMVQICTTFDGGGGFCGWAVVTYLNFPVGKVLPVVGPHDLRRGNARHFGFQLDLLANAGHHVGERGAEAGVFRRF